jgi:hypothetical protein
MSEQKHKPLVPPPKEGEKVHATSAPPKVQAKDEDEEQDDSGEVKESSGEKSGKEINKSGEDGPKVPKGSDPSERGDVSYIDCFI